ncbi:BTAD domain-containing putative transcriptional regulator [Haloactinomyces albus]|uniref:ATPase/DNA-binding SARP family transcriptional activator n=1 Tax=Haloactinomyces albus TaxID=1352928 RepID=A0AAE3ZDQ5_9ACTN|nr:BTAD domain-containing putative transcriptional regulator [Haloactinomyces albus]MDR7301669.1 putative ATPase/DNA-binding SARP family transcriptional activator [Haloactinomyces albus]
MSQAVTFVMAGVSASGEPTNAKRIDSGLCEAGGRAEGLLCRWSCCADGAAVLMRVLGPFQLHTGDDHSPVPIGGQRVRMLLARLALEPDRTVPTEVLIEDLWSGDRPARALNALQSLVSRARRALPAKAGPALRSDGAGYALAVRSDEIDMHHFERLATEGHRLLGKGETKAAATALRESLDLWRGSALVDFTEAPFAEATSVRLEELRLSALEDRIDADLGLGHNQTLVPELDALCARHPLRERFTALRIRALAACGRQADALTAYDDLRHRLAEELGVDPSRQLRELHLAVLRGDSAATSQTSPQSAPQHSRPRAGWEPRAVSAHGVPSRLSSFIGRESEIEQARQALRHSRLVTLFGPGGAGKTRLATESAADVEGLRVLFVELAPVRDEHGLPSTVLGALGLREARLLESQPTITDAIARLVDALSSEPTLLVLDNCEHVVSASAGLVQELVSRCPELRVLATSREPLALLGEKVLPVGPLGLPDTGGEADKAAAVRLFVERATAVRPGFALTEHNTEDVVEICRRLDGMPLAIELAAARLRAMSARQVADRLDDRFRLLTSGNRTSMPRHRTLRAVVEWSWELLDEPERALARRLSVFAGAVDAETIGAVCADDDPAADEVVYVLASLVEKSLVEAVENERGMRYRMLETVRAYCAERLDEAGEHSETRLAHAEHFLDLAETGGSRIHLGDQVEWIKRLDTEHDNILAALHWAIASGDAARSVRFAAALGWYWSLTAQHTEVITRLNEVMALSGQAPPESRAVVDLMRGFFSDSPEWASELRRAAARVREADAMSRYRYVAIMEPMAWLLSAGPGEAERSVQRALEHPDPWVHAAGLYARAVSAERSGDPAGGEHHARAAAEAFEEVGDRWGVAQTMTSLAGFRSLRGDHAGAIEVLGKAVASIRQLRSTEELVPLLARTGMEKVRAGDLDGARQDLVEAGEIANTSFPYHRVTVWCGLAEIARIGGDLDSAHENLRRAHSAMDETWLAPQPLRQLLLAFEARLRLDEKRFGAARERLATAVEVDSGIGDMPLAAMLAEQSARLLSASGEAERAAHALGLAVAMRGMLDNGDPEVRAMLAELDTALDPKVYRRAFDNGSALAGEQAHAELARILRGG